MSDYPPDVLFATNVRPRVGGLQTFVNALARALRERGVSVGVLTPLGYAPDFEARGGADRLARTALANLPPMALGMYLAAQGLIATRLLALARRGRPRVLHCMDVAAANALRPIAGALGIPLVLTVHGYLRQTLPVGLATSALGRGLAAFYDWEERRACAAARVLTAVSAARAAAAQRSSPRPVRVVENFADVDRFSPPAARAAARAALDPAPGLLLGSVGVLERLKGLHVALEALARTPPEVRLLIAGDGPARPELEIQARSLGLANRVGFLGSIRHADTIPVFQGIDAFLLPSISHLGVAEAAPLALLEASACGAPIVCSNIGGMAEIVRDGETGLLVPEGDALSLAAGLRRLLDEPGLRAELGHAAAERMRAHHSHRVAAARYLELYEEASGGALAASVSGER